MEKSFKKTKTLVSVLAAMLVLIFAMLLMTDTADAATKYQAAEIQDVRISNIKEAPIGGYFLFEEDWTAEKVYCYYAKTLDGTKRKFATIKLFGDNLSTKILTNGSKIYYCVETGSKGKIYCGNIKGGTPKLLKTVKVKDNHHVSVLSIYNGKLYYQISDPLNKFSEKSSLYSLNLKSKELKKISSNVNTHTGYAPGSGRYLYGGSLGKDGIRVFDCKTNKIVRTIKEGYKVRTDGGKLYYSTYNSQKEYVRIYCASLSGANRKLLLKLPHQAMIKYMGADVICYQLWGEGVNEEGWHVYTLATGEDKVVDGTAESGYKWEMS